MDRDSICKQSYIIAIKKYEVLEHIRNSKWNAWRNVEMTAANKSPWGMKDKWMTSEVLHAMQERQEIILKIKGTVYRRLSKIIRNK